MPWVVLDEASTRGRAKNCHIYTYMTKYLQKQPPTICRSQLTIHINADTHIRIKIYGGVQRRRRLGHT